MDGAMTRKKGRSHDQPFLVAWRIDGAEHSYSRKIAKMRRIST